MFLFITISFRLTDISNNSNAAETDLGEGCIPVGRYLGLFCKSNSFRVEGFCVVPKTGIVVKSHQYAEK